TSAWATGWRRGSTRPSRPSRPAATTSWRTSTSSARRSRRNRGPEPFDPSGQARERAGRRADQDVHAAGYQGQSVGPARRPLPDAGGDGGVLQPGAADEPDQGGEGGPGGVPAQPVIAAR